MIVADTGAVLALIDRDDEHHERLITTFRRTAPEWVLPWAILPEIDHLLGRDRPVARPLFVDDLLRGAWAVEWGTPADLERARELDRRYRDLDLGLVDGVVMAVAERLGARAIATLDLRDFAPVELRGDPALLPRDEA